MNELSPQAKAFIDAARPHEEPAAGERDRVRGAIAANLAAAAALGAAKVSTASAAGGLAAKGASAAGDLAVKGASVAGDLAVKSASVAGDLAVKSASVAGNVAAKGALAAGGLAAKGASIASFGAAAKVAVSLAIVGAVGGGVVSTLRSAPWSPTASTTIAPPSPASPSAVGRALPSSEGAPAALPAEPAEDVAPVDSAPQAAAPAPEPNVASGPAALAGERPEARPKPKAAPRASAEGSTARPPRADVAGPAPSSALPQPSPLDEEVRQLREVQRALREGDAGRALRLVDASDVAPGSALRDEQRAARFFALCRLGRADEAKAEAARLLAASPNSPVVPRVRKGCPPPGAP